MDNYSWDYSTIFKSLHGNSTIVKFCSVYIPQWFPTFWSLIMFCFLLMLLKVLKVFTCSDTDNGTCNNGEFISISHFKTVEAYTTAIQSLLNAYPGMEDLIECQTVKDAFSEILIKHCKPLKRYIRIVWVAMVFLSVIMGVLVLVWTTQAHHEQNYHSSDGSVKPHIQVANMLDSGPAKASNSSSENTSV